MIVIPTRNLPDYTQTVQIEEDTYDIRIQWNPRQTSWQIYIGFSGFDPAIKTKLVNGIDIFEPYRHLEGVPKGGLYLVDSIAVVGRPSRNDFGPSSSRFKLLYLTEEEINA